jgi:mercuric reductase
MKPFDLIILAGGVAVFAAAIRTNDPGARTAIINTGLALGGTCVNVGCVPSKTLLWAAEVAHTARHHGVPGVQVSCRTFAPHFEQSAGHEHRQPLAV